MRRSAWLAIGKQTARISSGTDSDMSRAEIIELALSINSHRRYVIPVARNALGPATQAEGSMSESASNDSSQVERNYRAFKDKLPELVSTHAGKLALMHDGEIIDFFDSYADAVRFGLEKYKDVGRFSVQEVTEHTISLGVYSYASCIQ